MPDSSWLVSFTRVSVSFSILRRNMMIFLTKMADAGVLAMRMAIPMNVAHLQSGARIIPCTAHDVPGLYLALHMMCLSASCSSMLPSCKTFAMENANEQIKALKHNNTNVQMLMLWASGIPDLEIQQDQGCNQQRRSREELIEEGVEELHDMIDICRHQIDDLAQLCLLPGPAVQGHDTD